MIGAPILQLLSELPPADESLRDADNEAREEGLEKLNAIKSALHVMKNPEIKRQLNKQSNKLGIILNYLLSPHSTKSEVSVCVDILSVCVEALDSDSLFLAFHPNLSLGLQSTDHNVCLLSIKMLFSLVKTGGDSQVDSMLSDEELVESLVQCVASSLDLASKACQVIQQLLVSRQNNLTNLRKWDFIQSQLRQVAMANDVVRMRVHELLVDCCVESEQTFSAISTWSLFEDLVSDSLSEDILIQLNTFMVLSSLASCEHGFEYLDSKGIFLSFSNLLQNVDTHPFSNLLLPGLLKFFGGVCQHKPDKVLSEHPQFLSKLFTQMSLGDSLALETMAFIARSATGKRILNSSKEEFYSICLHLTGSLCHSVDVNQRANGFSVASDLFHVDPQASTNSEVSSILKDWWSNLGFTWTFFLEKLQEPFEDVQIAIHQVLTNVLPHHSWALEPFSEAPGFMEYILGRRTDVGRGVLLSKYELVCSLADSNTARQVLGDRVYVKLQAYKSNGPYFSLAQDPQVAVERD